MATNPELMRVKESVKEKFWNLSETSHILIFKSFRSMNTLKWSSKTCQNFFPNIKKQPQLTSHYVSKILDSERKHEPGKQSKKGRRLKTKMLHGEYKNS